MNFRILMASVMLLTPFSAIADGHTEAAKAFIKATSMHTAVEVSRDNVLDRLDAYGKRLLSSARIKGNPKAVRLTKKFMKSTRKVAKKVYAWKKVEELYIAAVKETYSEEELTQFNTWLTSKYGKIYISRQRQFLLKTMDIVNVSGKLFQQQVTPMEKEYNNKIREL